MLILPIITHPIFSANFPSKFPKPLIVRIKRKSLKTNLFVFRDLK
jgi:hypothetical protein